MRTIWRLVFTLLFPVAAFAGEVTGLVTNVQDGDSMTVVNFQGAHKIRLISIDAPELEQPYGKDARSSLRDLCMFKWVTVDAVGKDLFKRDLALVRCAGADASTEQVRRGMAWVFRRHTKRDHPLLELEDEARKARRGLWRDAEPVAPWDWRRGQNRLEQ
jgi:endonuclease YncB( thermonuclease family)